MSISKKIAVYYNLRSGGAKRCLKELVNRLSEKHIVDIYTSDKDAKSEFECVRKIKIFPFNPSNFFLFALVQIFFQLKAIHKRIANEIDATEYDVVFSNHDIYTKSPYLLRFIKTPSIYLCHEPPREYYEKWYLFSTNIKFILVNLLRIPIKYIDKKNVSKANIVLSNSRYSQEVLKKIYKRKIGKLRLGVDSKLFIWQKKKRKNFYLSVGSLAKFKGHDFIIESLGLLSDENKLPFYIVANGGRDEKALKKLARNNNVKLLIKKDVNDKELVCLYNKAKFLLIGAYDEPFGLTALEAMSCGLPVIAVKEGGLIETITPETHGQLVERNKNVFVKTLLLMNKTKFNNNQIRNVVKKSWKWSKTVRQLEKYIAYV